MNAEAGCDTFVWIGQPFTSCDDCGKPLWDHAYEGVPGKGPFSEMERRPVSAGWSEACRRQFGPALRTVPDPEAESA